MNKNNQIKGGGLAALVACTLLFLSACDWYPRETVIGTGDPETMDVQVTAFDGVSVTGTCDVDLRIGDEQTVTVSAQRQILDVMTFEVRDGILNIGFRNGVQVKNSDRISAEIVIPSLSYVAITGAGNYTLEGPRQEKLDIYITGTGDVGAYNMEVEDCWVDISGAGSCELNVMQSLDVHISGVGDISYRGFPEVTSDVSGVGHITEKNN